MSARTNGVPMLKAKKVAWKDNRAKRHGWTDRVYRTPMLGKLPHQGERECARRRRQMGIA